MTEEKSLQYRGLKAFEKTERLLEILEAQLNSTTPPYAAELAEVLSQDFEVKCYP